MFKRNKIPQVIATLGDGETDLTYKNIPQDEMLDRTYQMMITLAVAIAGSTDIVLNDLMAQLELDASKILSEIAAKGDQD